MTMASVLVPYASTIDSSGDSTIHAITKWCVWNDIIWLVMDSIKYTVQKV